MDAQTDTPLMQQPSHEHLSQDSSSLGASVNHFNAPPNDQLDLPAIVSEMASNAPSGFLKLCTFAPQNAMSANFAALCWLEGIGTGANFDAAYQLLHSCQGPDGRSDAASMRTKALIGSYYWSKQQYVDAEPLLHEAVQADDAYALLVQGRCQLGRPPYASTHVEAAMRAFTRVVGIAAFPEDAIVAELARVELCRLHVTQGNPASLHEIVGSHLRLRSPQGLVRGCQGNSFRGEVVTRVAIH